MSTQQKTIPGYTYGTAEAARSPVSLDELARLKESVLFGPADEAALHQAGQVLADQVEDVLDVWYGFVLAHPFLSAYFSTTDGQVIGDYARRVRARFGQWIIDTCNRPYDQAWLDYAEEIGLRHTAAKKNATDDAPSLPQINMRYLIAFIVPITTTIRPFLARKGHREEEVEAMHQAWFKAVTLQAALWSRPYADDAW